MALLLAKNAKIIFAGDSPDQFSLLTHGSERPRSASMQAEELSSDRSYTTNLRVLALDRLSDAPGFQRVHSHHSTFHILWFL